MSNWTHVAGVIRINGFNIDGDTLNEYIEKYKSPEERIKECIYDTIGRHVGFGVDEDNIPEPHLPMGSEGSLDISIHIQPLDVLEIAVVTIFGDLRDHYSANSIIDWFKEVCDKLWVRQATITVDNEYYGTISYTYKEG